LPETVRVEFTVHSSFRKVDRLKVLVSEIDNHYYRLKADTGQKLNFECRKPPWEANLRVAVEGPRETVRDFLKRIRPSVERLGLKGFPEYWYEMA
jgi:hypothetical protein